MALALNQLGQVSLSVDDIEAPNGSTHRRWGLRRLYRFGDLVFFDCAGVRLFIEKSRAQPFSPTGFCSVLSHLRHHHRGARADGTAGQVHRYPHLIAPMEDWMVFFNGPAGNTLALMEEAQKGYRPPPLEPGDEVQPTGTKSSTTCGEPSP